MDHIDRFKPLVDKSRICLTTKVEILHGITIVTIKKVVKTELLITTLHDNNFTKNEKT